MQSNQRRELMEDDVYSAMPQASNRFKFNSEGSDQGTIGRDVSGLQSSALKSPVKFDQEGRVD